MLKYRSSIAVRSGQVFYGTDPNKLTVVAKNTESAVESSAILAGLEPKTTYFYQVRATDYYGKTATSKVESFSTAGENIALNKKVEGTFVFYPADDKYVKPGENNEILARITDGGTNYFTSMATSGSIPNADQYIVIDLGKSRKINSILSYWRRLAYPENMTIQLSNDKKEWKTVEKGIDANLGVFARSSSGDPIKVVSKEDGGSARYVKLFIKKGSPFYHKHGNWNFVQLMEVEVYAD